MGVSRRTFLKISGMVAAGTVTGGLVPVRSGRASAAEVAALEGTIMLNDVSNCIGCLSCAIACKKANELLAPMDYSPVTNGDSWTTVRFLERKTDDGKKPVHLKIQCMHCSQPSCVSVCPTGAAYKRDDGVVSIDPDICIGCKYCVMSCPFEVPGINEETGIVRKCTFCEGRIKEGKIPACAEACPAGAIQFGGASELLLKAEERLEYLKSNGFANAALYGKTDLGGLKVLYLLPDTPDACGLPGNPKRANGDAILKWCTGLAMAGFLVVSPLRKIFTEPQTDGTTGSGPEEGGNKDA